MSTDQPQTQLVLQKEPWWMGAIKQLGVPTALLIALGVGGYRASAWVGENVVKPLTDRQIKFIDSVDENVQKISVIVEEHQKNNVKIADELGSIDNGVRSLNETTKMNGQRLEAIEGKLDKGGI